MCTVILVMFSLEFCSCSLFYEGNYNYKLFYRYNSSVCGRNFLIVYGKSKYQFRLLQKILTDFELVGHLTLWLTTIFACKMLYYSPFIFVVIITIKKVK